MTETRTPDTRIPRSGDVVVLDEAGNFTYVDELVAPVIGPGVFEIVDPSGEMFIVERAADLDEQLRSAVHDDGERVAWRVPTLI